MITLTGHFAGMVEDMESGKARITFEVAERKKAVNALPEIRKKELRISISQNRRRRSLTANGYYWQLVGKIAEALKISQAHLHNIMLRRYGQIMTVDNQNMFLVAKDSEEVQRALDEAETFHLKPTSELRRGNDGEYYRTYLMLRGSHDYNTKEMARLIDGVVTEAKDLGIETLPQHEIERMKNAWKN